MIARNFEIVGRQVTTAAATPRATTTATPTTPTASEWCYAQRRKQNSTYGVAAVQLTCWCPLPGSRSGAGICAG